MHNNRVLGKELTEQTIREMFFELNRETDIRFDEMKEKYTDSLLQGEKEMFLETILVNKEEEGKYEGSYFSVINEKEGSFHMENEIYLTDVYLDVCYADIQEITENRYEAWIDLGNEIFEMEVVIEEDYRYKEKLERLYKAFILNGQRWRTFNMSHLKRMYRIKVINHESEMTGNIIKNITENRDKISYDFGTHQENIIMNKKLLWNVEESQLISNMFIRPVKNDISFEYVIGIRGNEGILVENTLENDIMSCYMERGKELHIITRKKVEGIWNTFIIKSVYECRKILDMNKKEMDYVPQYFHFTNYKEVSFIEKLIEKYRDMNKIRSTYFLKKKFLDYEFIKENIFLEKISINDINEEITEIYDCNYFVKDDYTLFFNDRKLRMDIFVKAINRNKYTEDFLSFIISDIQMEIPEYLCRGILNEE